LQGAFRIGDWLVEPPLNTIGIGERAIRLEPKAMKVLVCLAESPNEVVSKERLIGAVWPDTFVSDDVLTHAIAELRRALRDDARSPRFIQTIPKGGYRLIAAVHEGPPPASSPTVPGRRRRPHLTASGLALAVVVMAGVLATLLVARRSPAPVARAPARLTRLTQHAGLQTEPTFSPDGRLVAYASDQAGNFDIWVRPVTGGEAVQVTKDHAHDWQPDWSPDGSRIAFRSERGGGGLFVVSPLGGDERKVGASGYRPRWSPDAAQLLFMSTVLAGTANTAFVMPADGGPAREVHLGALAPGTSLLRPAAAWYRDSHHVSVLLARVAEPGMGIAIVDLRDDSVTRAQIDPTIEATFKDLDLTPAAMEAHAWSADGTSLVFVGTSNNLTNIWRLRFDPGARRSIGGLERLTTGPEDVNRSLTLGFDGQRVAYVGLRRQTRIVAYPLDASGRSVSDRPHPLTPAEVAAVAPDLTRDGARLLFHTDRKAGGDKQELRELSVADGRMRTLHVADQQRREYRSFPRYSPDGRRVSYRYLPPSPQPLTISLRILDTLTGEDAPLTSPVIAPGMRFDTAWGWSPDGREIIASGGRYRPGRQAIARLAVSAAPHAEADAHIVTTSHDERLSYATMSPDGRWIGFSATPLAGPRRSILYAVRSDGGPWLQLTDARSWADKPRWSVDGNRLYYLSADGGLFNVWAIDFDSVAGRPRGIPYQVTRFSGPVGLASHLTHELTALDFGVSRQHLALMMTEASGHIWMLDGIGP
jgi:Tol biopolymer transport system component/DNA-binding winged helix-turn-helix (wHTH) protein